MSKLNDLGIAPFDASDYLDHEETIAEYLTAALENPDPVSLLVAVRDVAKARGIAKVAADAGLGRESLYKALKPGAHPRFDTVRRLLEALGVKLDVTCGCRIIDYAASGSSTNPRQCDHHRKLSMFARFVVTSPATLAGVPPRSEA